MTEHPAWLIPTRLDTLILEASRSGLQRRLARGLGHDIRGPLQTLILASPTGSSWGTEADIKLLRSAMGHATGRLGEIADLVAVLSAGASGDEPEPLALSDLLPRVASLNRLYRGATVADLQIDSPAGHPAVIGHAGAIVFALLQLVLNARDAVDRVEDPTIRVVSAGTATGEMALSVIDNGPGVDPALVDRIFDPFVTSRPDEGLGLGLPAARLAVRPFGGRVTLERTGPGETCFTLQLREWQAED